MFLPATVLEQLVDYRAQLEGYRREVRAAELALPVHLDGVARPMVRPARSALTSTDTLRLTRRRVDSASSSTRSWAPRRGMTSPPSGIAERIRVLAGRRQRDPANRRG